MSDPRHTIGTVDNPAVTRPGHGRAKSRRSIFIGCSALSRRLTVAMLVVGVVASLVSGCTTGSFQFDGGHVPIGGGPAPSRLIGVAFNAESTSTPVPGATVTVINNSYFGVGQVQSTTTAADGTFSFDAIPNSPSINQYSVSVTPAAGSDRISQKISFQVFAGTPASVLVALPRVGFDQTAPSAVTISPTTVQMHTGDTVHFTGQVNDVRGNPLQVSPSMVFVGGFGVLLENGLFESTGAGTGSVIAFWDTGHSLLQSPSANITVDSKISGVPPPPPTSFGFGRNLR